MNEENKGGLLFTRLGSGAPLLKKKKWATKKFLGEVSVTGINCSYKKKCHVDSQKQIRMSHHFVDGEDRLVGSSFDNESRVYSRLHIFLLSFLK
jgi:hypothetical protein